ncbi:MAG: hypothetical protein ABFS35_12690 [Bacteroidota bacterium]
MTKKHVIIILLIGILLSSITVFLIFNKKQDIDILYKVPKNAASVLVVNTFDLSSKLFFDDLGKSSKNISGLIEHIPDSLSDIDLSKSGLEFLDKIVLFSTEDSISLNHTAFILTISDIDRFNNFADSISHKLNFIIEEDKGIKQVYYKSLNLILVWNNDFIAGTKAVDDKAGKFKTLKKVLSTRKGQSIMADSNFVKGLANKFDGFFYSKPGSENLPKRLGFLNDTVESVSTFINFNDGEIEITASLKQKKGSLLDKLFINPEKEVYFIENVDSSIVNIDLNVKPAAFFQIARQLKSVKINTKKFPYFAAWDGRMNLVANGSKIIENEFITYEYDDNFNKVEVKEKTRDKIWDIKAILGVKEPALDSIYKQNPLIKYKSDTLLFKGSNFIINKIEDNYLTYNKHTEKPRVYQTRKKENISVRLDFKRIIELTKELGFKNKYSFLDSIGLDKLKLTVSKRENILIACHLYLEDKEKNAFFNLSEYFQKNLN